MNSPPDRSRAGALFALVAFGAWGLNPVYFKAVAGIPPLEVLSHRITWSVVLLLPLVVAGGRWRALVRAAANRRVMRLLLARPVSRLRLMIVKYLSCTVYTFVLMQFIAWTALGLGIILRGWGGGLFVFVPERGILNFFDADEGLKRYAIGCSLLSLSMMAATSGPSLAFKASASTWP